jgi:hypothetical protein
MRLTRTTMSGAKARMKRLCTKRYAYYVTPPFMRLTRTGMSANERRCGFSDRNSVANNFARYGDVSDPASGMDQ